MSSLRFWLGRQPSKPQHWGGGEADSLNVCWGHKCAHEMKEEARASKAGLIIPAQRTSAGLFPPRNLPVTAHGFPQHIH